MRHVLVPCPKFRAQALARGGQEALLRVLGIEPRLDGVALDGKVVLPKGSRSPRDAELQLDEVEPGDRLVTGCST
jgi:hypothetical protein